MNNEQHSSKVLYMKWQRRQELINFIADLPFVFFGVLGKCFYLVEMWHCESSKDGDNCFLLLFRNSGWQGWL